MSAPVWFKSTFSAGNGNCVEVAWVEGGMLVRDSNDPDGPWLECTLAEFRDFVSGVKAGDFDPS